MSKFQYYTTAKLIQYFLSQGKEGDCWDFKQEWHQNMEDLLKDIICFANTVHDENCYLIFGISDTLEVTGMQKKRVKQADIIEAISNLVFAGDVYPKIEVQAVKYQGVVLDVLTVMNVDFTPIYLKRRYGKMYPGCIYTRVGDKNTPDNGNADTCDIENLWRKRLGLTKPPLEYIYDRLCNKAEWTQTDWGYYNVYRPEYTLEVSDDEDDERDAPFYAFAMPNSDVAYEDLNIKYQLTVLDSYQIAVLDGGRLQIPSPDWGFISYDEFNIEPKYAYRYYVRGNKKYRVLEFLYDPQNSDHSYAFMHLEEVVAFFKSEEERVAFEAYLEENREIFIEAVAKSTRFDYISADTALKTEYYRKHLRVGAVITMLLEKWRSLASTEDG